MRIAWRVCYVQHAERQTHRRPDENKHFGVVPVFEPAEGDLRIYVDIDVMRDMEGHALSNTGVELGGVLLPLSLKVTLKVAVPLVPLVAV